MQLTNKRVIESKTTPGVRFTVRCLNMIQRARRDMNVADQRLAYTTIMGEYRRKLDELVGDFADAEKRRERIKALTPEQQDQLLSCEHRSNNIKSAHLLPATIRAGLISIDGIESESGKPITADELLESGVSDALLDEIYDACEDAAGLTQVQEKNLQSLGTSPEQETGAVLLGSAMSA